mgnify:CR=1 FL=1
MDHATQQRFAQQLALWTESAIEQGRFPFRKVELAPPILSAAGSCAPPLVLWLNRSSYLAGGAIFLPHNENTVDHSIASACAKALGLNYYVCWMVQEIVIYRLDGSSLYRQTLPKELSDPDAFRQQLLLLLEQLKILAICETLPTREIDAYALYNFLTLVLKRVAPQLEQCCRQAQSHFGAHPDPVQQGKEKGMLILLRLLALLLFDRMPPLSDPQQLERASAYALETLPEELATILRPSSDEPEAPEMVKVRFHQLVHRLTQLEFATDRPRTVALLQLLLEHTFSAPAAFPWPFPFAANDGSCLAVNCPLPSSCRPAILVAAKTRLATAALLRHIDNQPELLAQGDDLFALPVLASPSRIVAHIDAESLPDNEERRRLQTCLRLSWPNRRLPVPPRTPLWGWQGLHLIGLAAAKAQIHLALPAAAIHHPSTLLLLTQLQERTSLLRLRLTDEALFLYAAPDPTDEKELILQRSDEPLSLAREQANRLPASALLLLLTLPPQIATLLREERLVIAEEPPARAIRLFARSRLGRLLWQQLFAAPLSDDGQEILRRWRETPLPLPGNELLRQLEQMEATASGADVDRELSHWFGPLPLPEAPPVPACGKGKGATPAPRRKSEEIAQKIFIDGIPRFPEQYLYDHFKPELQRFDVAPGELTLLECFFDRCVLRDPTGKEIEAEGEETVQALRLAAWGEKRPLEIPADRSLTATITGRYLDDLRRLRDALRKETLAIASDARKAEGLAERLWNAQSGLPPWRWLREMLP